MMSYDNMDHAGWVEENIRASKRRPPSAAEKRSLSQGRGWHAAPDKLNVFQARAMTIFGIAGGGIYNAPISWSSVEWRQPNALFLNWGRDLATWDSSGLTEMVFLAHDAAVRLDISPLSVRWLRLGLWQRDARGFSPIAKAHPTLEEAAARHRARFPDGHLVRFAPPVSEEVA